MQKLLMSCAILLVALAAPSAAEAPATNVSGVIAIRAGHVITDAALAPRGASTIIVDHGRIVAINDAAAPIPDGATIVDLGAKTVLPGLIDAHVHLGGYADDPWYAAVAPKRTEEYAVAIGLSNALTTARAGFTTVRELGGGARATIAVRDAVADGLAPGVRILTAGTPLSAIGGHADATVGLNPEIADALDKAYPQVGVCTGVEGCAAAVRTIAKTGVDVIKFMATGGVLDDGAHGLGQQFSDAEMKSICDTAHSLGLKAAAHAHGARGIEAAVNAGVDSIEHGTLADDAAIKAMKAHGTYFVATLMAFEGLKANLGKNIYTANMEAKGRSLLEIQGRALGMAYRAGVPIALGTDAGVFKHGLNAQELGLMVKLGGMAPKDALYAATMGGAKLLGIDKETGSLVAGKSADLIAVDGDPQTDPSAVLRVAYVMVEGKPIPMH
jgi:imidazolonepropionase-like amidohydrolase